MPVSSNEADESTKKFIKINRKRIENYTLTKKKSSNERIPIYISRSVYIGHWATNGHYSTK